MTSSGETQGQREKSPPLAKHPSPAPFWRHWQWLAVFAVVTLAAVTVAFFSGNGNSTVAASQRASATASPSAGASAAAERRATAASRALAVTPEAALARMHVAPKLAAALKSWDAGHGGAALATASADLDSATQAAGLKLYAPMKLACSSLGTAVTDAQAEPPIPDAAKQKLYAGALGTLATAVADCRAGISAHPYGDEDIQTHENPTVLDRSLSDLAAGTKDLYLATVELKVANRR
jgi:hypothetical protein